MIVEGWPLSLTSRGPLGNAEKKSSLKAGHVLASFKTRGIWKSVSQLWV